MYIILNDRFGWIECFTTVTWFIGCSKPLPWHAILHSMRIPRLSSLIIDFMCSVLRHNYVTIKTKWHNNLRWKLQNIAAIHMTTENSPMTLCGFENRKWKSKTKFNESLFIDWFKKKHLNQGNGKYMPEFLNYPTYFFLSPWESKLFIRMVIAG